MTAFALMTAGCTGTVDDSSVTLKADVLEVDLATGEEVRFEVKSGEQDVTADSRIISNLADVPVKGNVFSPDTEGEFTFYAEYEGKQSDGVTVKVSDTRVATESKYERHVNIIELTGAWCINCPDGYQRMNAILNKFSMQKYADKIHIAAFHSNVEGKDELAVPQTQDIIKMFKGLAYPAFITDLRNVEGNYGILTDAGSGNLQPSIESSFRDYPAHCGVAVSSVMNGDKSKAVVTVKVASEWTSKYRVVLLVVEDYIRYSQKTPIYPDGQDDYQHRHVVRKVVTTYADQFTGEKITEFGDIKAGKEASRSWEVEVSDAWNLENTEIYALVLGDDGSVNNMNVCPVDGGNSGYNMKK